MRALSLQDFAALVQPRDKRFCGGQIKRPWIRLKKLDAVVVPRTKWERVDGSLRYFMTRNPNWRFERTNRSGSDYCYVQRVA